MRIQYKVRDKERSLVYVDNLEFETSILPTLQEVLNQTRNRLVSVDIETTPLPEYIKRSDAGLQPHLTEIATVQLSFVNSNTDFVFHVRKYGFSKQLKKLIASSTLICHNSIFEYQHLTKAGLVIDDIHDTMLLARLFIQAKTSKFKSTKAALTNVYELFYNAPLDKENQLSNWGADTLTEEQLIYAAKDAYITLDLFFKLLAVIQKQCPSILKFYAISRKSTPGLGDMMLNGVTLDPTTHLQMIKKWKKDEAGYLKELEEFFPSEMNINSPKQLASWISDKLSKTREGLSILAEWPKTEKTGSMLCDSDTLAMYTNIPGIKELLTYKKVAKQISTYGDNLRKFILPTTGKAHPSYTQCMTGSGRASSRSFNIQNMPRGEFKAIFTATEGYTLVGGDYGAMEVRVYAYHTKDTYMITAFNKGVDIYIVVASHITKKPLGQITKDERQKAKAVLLGRLFLLGPNTLVKYAFTTYGVDMTLNEAKHLISVIDSSFPIGATWQKARTTETKTSLKTVSRMGKIRILPHDDYYNKCVNHPIQSDAAAVMLVAIDKTRKALREHGIKGSLYCTVHDELLIEVLDKHVEKAKAILKDCMEQAMLYVFPEATLLKLVDTRAGKNWLDTK